MGRQNAGQPHKNWEHLQLSRAAGRKPEATTTSIKLGAWAGWVLWTSGEEVLGLVSDDKWAKAQTLVRELRSMVEKDPEHPSLIHITQTYPSLKPYSTSTDSTW